MFRNITAFVGGIILFYLFLWVVIVLQFGRPTIGTYWIAAVHKVKLDAAKRMPSPKLIVLGGSGAHFGISAKRLQDRLGLPCVNFASHAALEFSYHFYRVKQCARPGDIVFLCLEYEYYPREESWTPKMLDLTVDTIVSRDPDFVRQMSLVDKWKVMNAMSNRRLIQGFQKPIYSDEQINQNHEQAIYHPFYLNENGDQIGHGPKWQRPQSPDIFRPSLVVSNASIKPLAKYSNFAEMAHWAQENHVVLLVGYPNLARLPSYTQANIDKTETAIKTLWAGLGVDVIGSVQDAFVKPEDMLDTRYHPMEGPALERTDRLVPCLKPYILSKKQ
jgi:hypothetical protein